MKDKGQKVRSKPPGDVPRSSFKAQLSREARGKPPELPLGVTSRSQSGSKRQEKEITLAKQKSAKKIKSDERIFKCTKINLDRVIIYDNI